MELSLKISIISIVIPSMRFTHQIGLDVLAVWYVKPRNGLGKVKVQGHTEMQTFICQVIEDSVVQSAIV